MKTEILLKYLSCMLEFNPFFEEASQQIYKMELRFPSLKKMFQHNDFIG